VSNSILFERAKAIVKKNMKNLPARVIGRNR